MPRVLSDEQVKQYHERGYHFPLQAMSPEQAQALHARYESQAHLIKGRNNQKPHLLFPWLNELIRSPRILDAVEDVLGPDLLCWSAQFFAKPAGDPGYVSWHQDATYWGLSSPDVVTAWVDKLGNGRDANQAVANKKPLWRANQRNGLGSIQFDGSNDLFTLNPIPWALSLVGQTTYVVFRAGALTNNMNLQATNTNGYRFYLSGSNWGIETGGGIAVSDSGSDTANYHYMGMIFDGTQTGNSNRLKFRYDGAQQTLDFGATTIGTATSGSAAYFYFGTNNTTYFDGYIGTIMIWTRALNLSECLQVESYLKTIWATP